MAGLRLEVRCLSFPPPLLSHNQTADPSALDCVRAGLSTANKSPIVARRSRHENKQVNNCRDKEGNSPGPSYRGLTAAAVDRKRSTRGTSCSAPAATRNSRLTSRHVKRTSRSAKNIGKRWEKGHGHDATPVFTQVSGRSGSISTRRGWLSVEYDHRQRQRLLLPRSLRAGADLMMLILRDCLLSQAATPYWHFGAFIDSPWWRSSRSLTHTSKRADHEDAYRATTTDGSASAESPRSLRSRPRAVHFRSARCGLLQDHASP